MVMLLRWQLQEVVNTNNHTFSTWQIQKECLNQTTGKLYVRLMSSFKQLILHLNGTYMMRYRGLYWIDTLPCDISSLTTVQVWPQQCHWEVSVYINAQGLVNTTP